MFGSSTRTTVVIPVWDEYVEGLLREALPSLSDQQATPRVVIVDNASQIPVLAPPDISVVRCPKRVTLGASRNLGLAQVETPYVVFWDADDVMLPGTLGFLESAISSDPAFAAFGAAIVEANSGSRHRWPRRWIARLLRRPTLFALLTTIWSLYPTTGATVIRTELAREAGGFSDTDSGDDWCLGASLAYRGRLGWSERPGRLYRVHEGSIWSRYRGATNQLRHARIVRQRISQDPGIGRWPKLALPLIAAAQWAAIGGHIGVAAVRRYGRGIRR